MDGMNAKYRRFLKKEDVLKILSKYQMNLDKIKQRKVEK
tara:strand:- start:1776 stop:1892 length:117 start_codon:yes stop_codon:yes gene_type:complete